mgnify:CR=1 FL=1
MANTDELIDLLSQNIKEMLTWEIQHSKILEHGCYITIRKGELLGKEWWAVFLEAQVGNETHLKEIPPQSDWGDYVLMSFQVENRGMILWVYETIEEMIGDTSRLFGLFVPNQILE